MFVKLLENPKEFNMTERNDEMIIRPENFDDFVGQTDAVENLKISVFAALKRGEALDHVLLFGPPGLGKTTLANIIANELNVGIRKVSAPTIERPADIVCILGSLNPGDVLFIDEIHRLPKNVEEILYSAMEDFQINVILNKDVESKNIELTIPPFTLIGATTSYGSLSSPFRNRFGIKTQLHYYSESDLSNIIERTSKVYNFSIDDLSKREIAIRSRFTPRIANNLYKRVRDIAMYKNKNTIDLETSIDAFKLLKIDQNGLEPLDVKYLSTIMNTYDGGPVGLDALGASMNESAINIEEYIEPFLIQLGLITRTKRGRRLTKIGFQYIQNL